MSTVSFAVSANTSITVEVPAMNVVYHHAGALGVAGKSFGDDLVVMAFAGETLPTWNDYVAFHKESHKAHAPKGAKANTPNKRMHNALYQQFNLAAKIQEAVAQGFEPLAAWDAVAKTKTRETRPSLSLIAKMAKGFIKPVDQKSPLDVVIADVQKLYKHIGDLPNGKSAQELQARVVAIAAFIGADLNA